MTDRFHQHDDLDNATTSEPEDPLRAFFGELLSVYTRQQAIKDGILVDVSEWAGCGPEGMLGGFLVPVALTRALWQVIDLGDTDGRSSRESARWQALARQRGESTRGRAHDVLWMLRVAVASHPQQNRLRYSVLMTVEGEGGGLVQNRLTVEAVLDGDGVTIGFPEDF